MPHPDLVRCRAGVTAACYHGRDMTHLYEGESWTNDGTWLPSSEGGSIVCDPCYIALGTPDNGRLLEDAIVRAHEKAERNA